LFLTFSGVFQTFRRRIQTFGGAILSLWGQPKVFAAFSQVWEINSQTPETFAEV
jgi:hypothetical protein